MVEDTPSVVLAALEALDEAFAVFRAARDRSGQVTGLHLELLNAPAARWLGLSSSAAELLAGGPVAVDPRTLGAGLWELVSGVAGGSGRRREPFTVGTGPDGRVFEVEAAPFGEDRVALCRRDVTAAATTEKLLTSGRATLQAALDATSDAFAVFDVSRGDGGTVDGLCLRMVNAAGAASCGIPPDLLIGRDLAALLPAEQASQLPEPIAAALTERRPRTVRVHEHDGCGTWVAARAVTIAPVGTERVVLTWRDVTADERRERDLARAHDRAWYAATHDPLTGLANRALLDEQLREALWSADRDNRAAVVYVDLDHFKPVNDTLGHAAGDAVLRAVAGRLAGVIRTGDLAARVGGDEFVLLLRNVRQEWDTERFVLRLRAALEQPVLVGEAVVTPRASYGVAVSPPAAKDIDQLLGQADSLMYRDKLSRR